MTEQTMDQNTGAAEYQNTGQNTDYEPEQYRDRQAQQNVRYNTGQNTD